MSRWLPYVLVGGICLVAATYVSWRWVARDVTTTTFRAAQVTGGSLAITRTHSSRYYFGSHVWGYGGGDDQIALEFVEQPKRTRWLGKRDEVPRILQEKNGTYFLVSQRDPHNARFREELRFYRYDRGRWTTITAKEFPKQLAVCNLGSKHEQWMVDQALENRPPR